MNLPPCKGGNSSPSIHPRIECNHNRPVTIARTSNASPQCQMLERPVKRPSKPEKATTIRAGRRLCAADDLKAKQAALHSALAKVVKRTPSYTPPEPPPQPAIGAFRIDQLRQGQCRFACTADDVPRGGHRFCGAPTEVGSGNLHGSWCPEHLPHVMSSGGAGWISQARAAAKREARAA